MPELRIPGSIVDYVMQGKAQGRADMACIKFGPRDNECLVLVLNASALIGWSTWFLKAAEAYRAEGNTEEVKALQGFYHELQVAYGKDNT